VFVDLQRRQLVAASAGHCPVLMLQGTFSHEPPGTLAIFRLLGGRYPVHVANRIEQVALTARGEWLASTGWCFDGVPSDAHALFSCVPAVNKAVVAATVGAAEAAQAVGEHLAILLRGYAPTHRAARRQGVPTIGVSHGTVFGCVSEHGVPMAGFDHEFSTGALFAAEAQAFMLGHIHRHQAWEQESVAGRQCIAYPGSIGRFHYGEEGEKGFLFWEIDADQARFTLEPTPACRTIDIVFEGQPDLDALRTVVAQQDIGGAFVRVRWTVADEDRHERGSLGVRQLPGSVCSIAETLRRLRLTRAAYRLEFGTDTVTDIGLEAGYTAPEAFSRAFKVQFGESPSLYRERSRERRDATYASFFPPPEESLLQPSPGEDAMDVTILRKDPVRVACIRATGPYQKSAMEAWNKMMAWGGPKGLFGPGTRYLGVSHDDPTTTAPELLRYDACVTVEPRFQADGEAFIADIPGGDYAVTIHRGPYENLEKTYMQVYGQWLPASGREPDARPCYEVYLNDPQSTAPEELLTEINMPLKDK